ncbi:hypothetical protein PSHT_04610 [Puccinia striiformis]|uniref:Uncharacterized protein n=1 Tax=Puccinia striiformis TaxID=27350 RepID=A0A2S4WCH5_9BASI|nr:hypothetical protein PSHT_04610 [Puccinia striiformis]
MNPASIGQGEHLCCAAVYGRFTPPFPTGWYDLGMYLGNHVGSLPSNCGECVVETPPGAKVPFQEIPDPREYYKYIEPIKDQAAEQWPSSDSPQHCHFLTPKMKLMEFLIVVLIQVSLVKTDTFKCLKDPKKTKPWCPNYYSSDFDPTSPAHYTLDPVRIYNHKVPYCPFLQGCCKPDFKPDGNLSPEKFNDMCTIIEHKKPPSV